MACSVELVCVVTTTGLDTYAGSNNGYYLNFDLAGSSFSYLVDGPFEVNTSLQQCYSPDISNADGNCDFTNVRVQSAGSDSIQFAVANTYPYGGIAIGMATSSHGAEYVHGGWRYHLRPEYLSSENERNSWWIDGDDSAIPCGSGEECKMVIFADDKNPSGVVRESDDNNNNAGKPMDNPPVTGNDKSIGCLDKTIKEICTDENLTKQCLMRNRCRKLELSSK